MSFNYWSGFVSRNLWLAQPLARVNFGSRNLCLAQPGSKNSNSSMLILKRLNQLRKVPPSEVQFSNRHLR